MADVSVMVVVLVPALRFKNVTLNVVVLPVATEVLPKAVMLKSVVLEVVGFDNVAVPVPPMVTVNVLVMVLPEQAEPKSVLLVVL